MRGPRKDSVNPEGENEPAMQRARESKIGREKKRALGGKDSRPVSRRRLGGLGAGDQGNE